MSEKAREGENMGKKKVGFGFRGTMLILYQAIAFYLFTVIQGN